MAELNLKQIIDRLNAEFTGETRKLVFWYDDKAEFAEDMETVELQNAKIYHLQPDNQFYTKYFLERVDKTTNYLIYAPFPKPDVRDNHLEDTMLYSRRFFADRASLLSVDLGIRPNESGVRENALRANIEVDNCVVRADDYGSVMPHVLSNFANIVNLNYDMGTLYIQNPPRRVLESLKAGLDGDIEYYGSQYPELDRDALTKIYKALNSDVYGQDECKKQILSGMYRLTTGATNKPVVLMLYGPSGVGKTESAKSISKSLGGELLRIQFSMMQTSEAYDYVFGAEHSKSQK